MDTLERFATGDLEAFEALFRQRQSEVYRWIVRLVRNPAVAEELTVDTFWRIYCHRRRFDPPAAIRAMGSPHRWPCCDRLLEIGQPLVRTARTIGAAFRTRLAAAG